MSAYKWSATAASNDTSDSTINWREGQSPSTVNNSARAMMAALAKYISDMSGNLVLGGTSTAYTLTSNQVFATLQDGLSVVARMNAASGTSPTLNVDSLGAKPIESPAGTAVPAGALRLGVAYQFTYDSSEDAWLVATLAALSTAEIPATTAMLFAQTAAPTGWTKLTTHNDKVLRVVSGTASSGGTVAFSTVFGRTATDAHTLAIGEIPSHTHNYDKSNDNYDATDDGGPAVDVMKTTTTATATTSAGGGGSHAHNIDLRVQYVDIIIATKDA